MSKKKEKLVVEVIAAHNLMPKDGEGSSSPFVEVEFENQRKRTRVKHKDLNPIWNQTLIFPLNDVADLPYRALEVSVFNEKRSSNSRNFLGKIRVSCFSIARETEGSVSPKLYTLEKRSLFSHIRGEITLKVYVSHKEQEPETKDLGDDASVSSSNSALASRKKAKKLHQNKVQTHQIQQIVSPNLKQNPGEMKPIVVTTSGTNPAISSAASGDGVSGCGGGGGGGGAAVYSNGATDFCLKETSPNLGGTGPLSCRDKSSSTYDLVEQVQYLYVRVVKARDLPVAVGDAMAEVKLGNYGGTINRGSSLEWNQVFAFSKDCIQSSMAEIIIKEKEIDDSFVGRIWFDLNEVPRRAPPDSQLAPQWYRLENAKTGEVMVSIWFGTQADESFAEASHSKAVNVNFDGLCSTKSKVYLSPKLWYLRASIIEAQDVVLGEKGSSLMRFPELSVKAQVGNSVLRTRISPTTATRSFSRPYWNEDLMFVVAEPFDDYLLVSLEDCIGPGRDELVGRVLIPVNAIERRIDEKPVISRWFNLDIHRFVDSPELKERLGSRIHLRLSLDGGYHVLDESTMYISDVCPPAKPLCKPHVGVLELGILGATGLITPVKIRESGGSSGGTNAYCVAKYGQKWVRTRTVVDTVSPKWNEQYTWEVFDPCTVITVGVFDNSRVDKNNVAPSIGDSRIGKVQIRLSTLESDRVYTHSYPLLMLHASGVNKMGELHLALRFSCANFASMLALYTTPLLPKMHYLRPLSVSQLESLRHQAVSAVASRLSRAEPRLGQEVVEYMLERESNMWSMRKSKANFFRLVSVLSSLVALGRFLDAMRSWHKPIYSGFFVAFFMFLVVFPEIIVPAALLYMAVLGVWRYRARPRHPVHVDARMSQAEGVYGDELEEEFDSFPTSHSAEVVRARYDRLRSVAGRIQGVVGDVATQGERVESLLSWRDPRATFLFVIGCVAGAVGLYVVPMRVAVGAWGLYALRPPRFRSKLPSGALSFFRRLPARTDGLL